MSNFEIYAQSIDDAVLAYSVTEDTNFPITNIQDKNIKTFMKDTAIAAATVNIVIDLGAARSCDFILLGNYLATSADNVLLKLECHTADAWGGPTTAFSATAINSASLTDKLITFSAQNFRYWRLVFTDLSAGNLTDLQFGTIFLGTHWNWAHEPELTLLEDSGYNVTTNRAAGGSTFGQIANTTVRRRWNVPLKWISAAEKVLHETWRDTIFMDLNGGLSRHPFYYSIDNGTTILFSRYRGKLNLRQHAYQQWETNHVFEEEL